MKTVLITGASHGVGKATAEKFAQEGYRLFLNCRTSKDILIDYAASLSATYKIACTPVICDVSNYEQIKAMFGKIEAAGETIDILINNAGISYVGLLQEMEIQDWMQVLNTNLTALFSCCKFALPSMIQKKQGKIINISSVWGIAGASCETAYSASKGGVNAFTKALAKELAPSNIQVNAVALGVIDTRMNRQFTPSEREALMQEIPAGRFGTPQEAAALIWQLATAPDYLTGQILTLDGGFV